MPKYHKVHFKQLPRSAPSLFSVLMNAFQRRVFTCAAEVQISQRVHTLLRLLPQVWSLLRHPAAAAERRHDRHHAGDAQPVHQRPHGVRTQHQTALLHRSESTHADKGLFCQKQRCLIEHGVCVEVNNSGCITEKGRWGVNV